jgi:hypothetical protein
MLINPEDSLRYRVYKISKGDDQTNPDYAEWPTDFGAPIDENGNPLPAVDENGNIIPNAAKINDLSKFNSEMEELNSIETPLPFNKINFDDLGLTTIKVRDLIRIEFLFD